MRGRECLGGEPCDRIEACRRAEAEAESERAEIQAVARARKARARQEEGLECRSVRTTRYSA